MCRRRRQKMLRQQHGTAVRREKNSRRRRRKKPRSGKGFNWIREKVLLGYADSRFGKPRIFLKKVLIVAVRSYGYSVLNRGWQNLEASCEGERVVTFCIVQKVTKKHARTCKKLPVASFCASETAETGRIANGREQGDHVSRRRRSPATHDSKLCRK